MTQTPPEAPTGPGPHEGPRATREEIRDLGRLRRHGTDRKVAGVAGGIARHLDIDPVIIRIALVLLVFFGGAGLIIYGACWLLLPEDDGAEAAIRLDDRNRAVALVGVGVVAALALLGDSWGLFGFPWPLAIVALVVLLVMNRTRSSEATHGTPPPAGPVPDTEWAATQPLGTYAGPPPYVAPQPAPRPRKRGPILFWFAAALGLLGLGVLGILDAAGANLPLAAYPALVVGVCGAMLLLGAFWGRAGGLILVGLMGAVGLAGATVADQWEGADIHRAPTTAAAVEDLYELGGGELTLDLSGITDVSGLDGRTIEVDGAAGRIEVIVPDGIDVNARAEVAGPGSTTVFGVDQGGFAITSERHHDSGGAVPTMTLNVDLAVGEIVVRTESGSNQ